MFIIYYLWLKLIDRKMTIFDEKLEWQSAFTLESIPECTSSQNKSLGKLPKLST